MRFGVLRSTLRAEVYLEAGLPTAAAQTVQMDPRINQMLNRVERQLALKHTWVMQKFEAAKTHPTDQQYSTLPTTMEDFTKISEVWVLEGTTWLPLFFGIRPEHRSLYNTDQRAFPPQRWDLRRPDPDVASPQYEIWPIPAQETTLKFIGEEAAGAMSSDAAGCVLDADALVQWVAGELIAKKNPDEAKIKMANADGILRSIMARQKNRKRENFNMGARPTEALRPYIDFIPATE